MRIVSKIPLTIGIVIIVLTAVRCDKDSMEEDLSMSIDASMVEITPSSGFTFNLSILSEMPRSGVTIEFNVKGEFNNQVYFERRIATKSANNTLSIHNLPRQVMCISTITVTSNTKSNNVATASFRVGYK